MVYCYMRKLLLLLALGCTQLLFAQKTILHCGKLIDPKTLQVLPEMSIIVEGNLITDVRKGYIPAAAGDKLIDLKGRTVMPGLIDAHVHLEDESSPNAQLEGFTMEPAGMRFTSPATE